jgi:hypothetical protein
MVTARSAVVTASQAVADTRARSRKLAILAELLGGVAPDEVAVCVGLLSGAPRQGRVGIGHATIGSLPAHPAAAANHRNEAIAELGRASVEFKLDGLRVQVHRRGDEVRVYSRNLNDITPRLPGVVAAMRALPAQTAILDEALWMGVDGPVSFQDTMLQIDPPEPALRARRRRQRPHCRAGSNPCSRATWSSSAPSGATAAAGGGCPTCTSARATAAAGRM